MGFLSNLLGMTGPGRLGAALNALTAKHMLDLMAAEHQQYMHEQIIETLMQGSNSSYEYSKSWVDRLEPTAYYGLAAQIFLRMNLPPAFPKCFAGGRWNIIDNPLIGLHTGDNEIEMAQREILRKYSAQTDLKTKYIKNTLEITLLNSHNSILNWAHAVFAHIEKSLGRPLRREYLVAFSGMITTQCYLFACTGIKNKDPDTQGIINFISMLAEHLKQETDIESPELFLQDTMVEYRNLFTNGMVHGDMSELCSEFNYHYTLIDGLDDQTNELNNGIQMQCNIITESIAGLL